MIEIGFPNHPEIVSRNLENLNLQSEPTSLFKCQLALAKRWLTENDGILMLHFIHQLDSLDPNFSDKFQVQLEYYQRTA